METQARGRTLGPAWPEYGTTASQTVFIHLDTSDRTSDRWLISVPKLGPGRVKTKACLLSDKGLLPGLWTVIFPL